MAVQRWDRPRPDPESSLGARAWPVMPDDQREVAERLVELLKAEQQDALGARWEERLPDLADMAIERAIAAPLACGVSLQAANRLASDPAWRNDVRWAVIARGSLLWPLSLLLFNDASNVQCLGAGCVIVRAGAERFLMVGEPPEEFRGEDRYAADERMVEWFRDLVGRPGVSPTVALTEATPIATVTLPTAVGQARIAVTIAPATSGGAVDASIRIPRLTGPTTLDAFVAGGHIPAYVAEFLRALVWAGRSIVIGGPTHAGKTTLLASLCAEISDADVVLTIEEGPELALKRPRRDGTVVHKHTLEHVTVPGGAGWERDKVSFADHARHGLRYDAQWIILGEARGAEMADVLAAMTFGVPGMCTLHADHASMIMTKVYSYVVKAPEYSGNLALARELAWLAIDVAVHMEHRDGRHEITGIVAYNEHGGETVVYARGEHGGLERRAQSIDDLPPRLRDPLRKYLDEVPGP